MSLDDVCEDTIHERVEHYRTAYGMYLLPVHERQPIADIADMTALKEMTQEIHTMLLHLTKEARER